MRIALLMNLAPRKFGSGEDFMLRFCGDAGRRGHMVTLHCRTPIRPEIAGKLEALGIELRPLEQVESLSVRSIRSLSRAYEVAHLNLLAPRSKAALCCYAAIGTRVVFVDHVSGFGDPAPTSWAHRIVDRATALRCSRWVAISKYVLKRDQKRFGISYPRARLVYHGVDLERFSCVDRSSDGALRILAVANLVREKGLHLLFQALGNCAAEWRLRVAGDGPEAGPLRRLAEQLGIADRVEFLGLRDDVPALMRTAHVFVHPAVWKEAFGYTIAEGMASGCVVIASRGGSTSELIDDGRDGFLVPSGDARSLRRAIERVARDGGLLQAVSVRARETAVRRFGLADCVRHHLDLCEEAVGSREAS